MRRSCGHDHGAPGGVCERLVGAGTIQGWVPVRTVGFTQAPITTMGGLRLLPDIALAELPAGADAVRLFLLPGGDLWEGDYPSSSLEPVLRILDAANVPIAAICGATIAVARAGLLRGRRHTSRSGC